MTLGPPHGLGYQEAMQQTQTSLSRNRYRKGSFEWQVQLNSTAGWFSSQEKSYLHLLSM